MSEKCNSMECGHHSCFDMEAKDVRIKEMETKLSEAGRLFKQFNKGKPLSYAEAKQLADDIRVFLENHEGW